MSMPQAKRRRLNEAAKTLNKPFKSPFRTPLRPNIGSDPPSSDPPDINTPADVPKAADASALSTGNGHSTAAPAPAKRPPSTPATSNPCTAKLALTDPAPPTPSKIIPKKAPSKPALTREIIQLRNDMQILSQAHTLATTTKDDDLVVLIDKWRTVSRAVAEELFATTRDKVNRMGGVGAWKAREKEGKERQLQWDKEEREAERERMVEARENGEIGDDTYDRYAEMAEEHTVEKEEETFKANDDDSFTMDMMLKTLNVDLELLGYSKEAQRWEG